MTTVAAPNFSSETVRVATQLPSPESLLAAQTYPLVDPHGATFVYRGRADAVRWRSWITACLIAADATAAFRRCLGIAHRAATGSRIEYKFEIEQDEHVEWILDPLNPVIATDPFGANSVCRGYGYVRPQWTLPDPATKPGSWTRSLDSRAFGTTRSLGLYVPAEFERGIRYPLLVVHDGFDYLRYANLQVVLDNLIQRRDIPPLIAVLTQSPIACASTAATTATPSSSRTRYPQLLERRFALHRARRDACYGREFRRRGLAARGVAPSGGLRWPGAAIRLVRVATSRCTPGEPRRLAPSQGS